MPEQDVKTETVSLDPIKRFLNRTNDKAIKGDDPRNPDSPKIFSVAEIVENGQMKGYMYIYPCKHPIYFHYGGVRKQFHFENWRFEPF